MRNILIIIILTIPFLSCNKTPYFEQTQNIPDSTWYYKDTIKFNIEINETDKTYNVFIQLKNTNDYRYANLYLFSQILGPKNESVTDTVECIISDQKGKWFGKKQSGIWYNKLLLKKRIRFPEKGKYTFKFVQGMREDYLKNITNFGIIISEAKNEE